MEYIKKIYFKYKEVFLYLVFGFLTTVINTVTYYVFYEVISISNTISNIIAWIFAVLFAFATNKLFVFESSSKNIKVLLYEVATFMGFRLSTGLLDLAIMFVSVDLLKINALIMKIISNAIVIILNYIASKLVVFKKDKSDEF